MASNEQITQLVQLLEEHHPAYVLTGAGVSTASGIPDFRSPGGLWSKVDPMVMSSIMCLTSQPETFYAFWGPLFSDITACQPNKTHQLLACLEQKGYVAGVITQNIDGLHQKAGSRRVFECHGSFQHCYCMRCQKDFTFEELKQSVSAPDAVPYCACGGVIRPDVTLFGEMLPAAFQEAMANFYTDGQLLLAMGTSLSVYPANSFVPMAREMRKPIVIINREPTCCDDQATLIIRDELTSVAEQIMVALDLAPETKS